ncbi:hypothetical protein M6B38_354580 [Iris pallida]|uniref:Uncharacterized protein n=1 Tax=Iris pallida TaxID=29817 RepID=A0AAX6GPH3_IRIPA|nr:hypothetical protein M6B38_354580 [Iris pallida]
MAVVAALTAINIMATRRSSGKIMVAHDVVRRRTVMETGMTVESSVQCAVCQWCQNIKCNKITGKGTDLLSIYPVLILFLFLLHVGHGSR